MVKYNGFVPGRVVRCAQTGMFESLWDAREVVVRVPQVMPGRGSDGPRHS